MGYQVKSPVPGIGYHFSKCWSGDSNRHPKHYSLLPLLVDTDYGEVYLQPDYVRKVLSLTEKRDDFFSILSHHKLESIEDHLSLILASCMKLDCIYNYLSVSTLCPSKSFKEH